jgi:hypothetical protein
MLDQTATIFPGSRLRIRFTVRPPPRVGLAFPGSPVVLLNPVRHPESEKKWTHDWLPIEADLWTIR